jgi:hypothetical protein
MSSDGELAHLLPVHRSYALLAAAERVDWIRQERWIQYTRAEEVLVRMGELLAYPPRDRMPALLLFGKRIEEEIREEIDHPQVLSEPAKQMVIGIDDIR